MGQRIDSIRLYYFQSRFLQDSQNGELQKESWSAPMKVLRWLNILMALFIEWK